MRDARWATQDTSWEKRKSKGKRTGDIRLTLVDDKAAGQVAVLHSSLHCIIKITTCHGSEDGKYSLSPFGYS